MVREAVADLGGLNCERQATAVSSSGPVDQNVGMPFTPSHVAAALPFLRTPLVPAALVAGTVAPDVPYFVPLFLPRDLTHSLLGLVTVDSAIGVVCAVVWWWLLREPTIDLLPRSVGARIPAISRNAWRRHHGVVAAVGLLLLSVLVGAATHLLWDSFTHPGAVVDRIAVLRTPLGPRPLEAWLQYASSVGGLVVLGIWGVVWRRRTDADPARTTRIRSNVRGAAWAAIAAVSLIVGLAAWIPGLVRGLPPFDPELVFLTVRLAIGAAGAAYLLVILLWWIGPRLRPRQDAPSAP